MLRSSNNRQDACLSSVIGRRSRSILSCCTTEAYISALFSISFSLAASPLAWYIVIMSILLRRMKPVRIPRMTYPASTRILPRRHYSSGSPTPTSKPDDYFNKTGEKVAPDPALINMRSDEYSKSGGDDIVAEQVVASFKVKVPALCKMDNTELIAHEERLHHRPSLRENPSRQGQ